MRTEQEVLEELTSFLNSTDDSRSLGWYVTELDGRLIIQGDGVSYTKDEAMTELDKRARISMQIAIETLNALAKARE